MTDDDKKTGCIAICGVLFFALFFTFGVPLLEHWHKQETQIN